MKHARFTDAQRHLKSKKQAWATRPRRFSYAAIPTLGTGEFPIDSPFTAICGANGAGKTTLLRSIWRTFEAGQSDPSAVAKKLTSGKANLGLIVDDEELINEVEFIQDGVKQNLQSACDAIFIDSSHDSRRYQAQFGEFEGIDDIINGEGGKELDEKSVKELSFLACRDYRSIKLYEVDLGDIVPFFEVSYKDDRYDSRTMGAGEIAVFHLWWAIDALKAGQVALIEEPEAFLSHSCQVNLSKHMIAEAVDKRFAVITSTHSAPLIGLLPPESIKYFVRDGGGIRPITGRVAPAIMKSVGIDPPIALIALVEDEAAVDFGKLLLEKVAPSFARRVKFIVRNGDGEITNSLRAVEFYPGPPYFVGLYDGDVRGAVPESIKSKCAFLPGDRRIEAVFRHMVNSGAQSLSTVLGRGDLGDILHSLEGAEDHDWFRRLGDELGLTRTQLFPILFGHWFGIEGNDQASIETFEALLKLVPLSERGS